MVYSEVVARGSVRRVAVSERDGTAVDGETTPRRDGGLLSRLRARVVELVWDGGGSSVASVVIVRESCL